jgi:hypothetical protein
MVQVKFIRDFATKKKEDIWKCDSMLGNRLINKKVAKKYKKVAKK